MAHGGTAIWGGSRVRVLMPHNGVRQGAEGVNLGRRQDGDTLVRLDDGREEYLPLALLERIDKEKYVADAINWKPLPDGKLWHAHHADIVKDQTEDETYVYRLRGWSGRWYVARTHKRNGISERTKFYANHRLAEEAFSHLAHKS